jgi:hypothetical protein
MSSSSIGEIAAREAKRDSILDFRHGQARPACGPKLYTR